MSKFLSLHRFFIFFSVLFFLPLLVTLSWAAPAEFGGKGGFVYDKSFQVSVQTAVPDDENPLQSKYLRNAGGGLLVATTVPKGSLVGKILDLDYNVESDDGARVNVMDPGLDGPVSLPVYDWILRPVVEFVESGDSTLVSVTDPQTTFDVLTNDIDKNRIIAAVDKYGLNNISKVIRLHPAFENRTIGLRILQGDLLYEKVFSANYLPTESGNYILEAGEEFSNVSFGEKKAEGKALQIIGSLNHWFVLTDANRIFTVSVVNSPNYQIQIGGNLRILNWQEGPGGEYNLIDDTTSNLWVHVCKSNQIMCDAVTTVSRLSSFFRYIKKTNPKNWNSFVQVVKERVSVSEVPTPSLFLR